jgi:hypothetical protein
MDFLKVNSMNTKKVKSNFLISILMFGIYISIFQYLKNRSLWFDESMISLNIINKDIFELLKPLDYNQVAPILFLILEKLITYISTSEFSLRLLPLICFCISGYLYLKIIRIFFENNYTILFSLSMFAFNITLLYYSSEVKQYMFDVFVLILLYYFSLKSYKKEINKYYNLSISGCLAVFISNITPIILLTVSIYLMTIYLINKKSNFKPYLFLLFSWFSTFIFYYLFFIYNHSTRDFMIEYWEKNNSFMPNDIFKSHIYEFIWVKILIIFNSITSYSNFLLFLFLSFYVIGVLNLIFKKRFRILLLLLFPITIHFILSALKIYPFDLRLVLYIFPIIMFAISFGFDFLISKYFTGNKIIIFRFLAIFIPFIFLINLKKYRFTTQNEEIKNSLTYIKKNINRGDYLYIYYGAGPAYKYYSDVKYFNNLLPVINGGWNRENPSNYIKEITVKKGEIWILFSHVYKDEESNILQQLDSLGYSRLTSYKTYNSSAYLYDLSK